MSVKCLQCGAPMESTIGPHRYSRGIDVVLHGIEILIAWWKGRKERPS